MVQTSNIVVDQVTISSGKKEENSHKKFNHIRKEELELAMKNLMKKDLVKEQINGYLNQGLNKEVKEQLKMFL